MRSGRRASAGKASTAALAFPSRLIKARKPTARRQPIAVRRKVYDLPWPVRSLFLADLGFRTGDEPRDVGAVQDPEHDCEHGKQQRRVVPRMQTWLSPGPKRSPQFEVV